MIDNWVMIQFKIILFSIWLKIGFFLWEFTTVHLDDGRAEHGRLFALTFSRVENWDEIDNATLMMEANERTGHDR